MMRAPTIIAITGLMVALTCATPHVDAQCLPEWITELGDPGNADGYVQPMTPWDDGTGEALFAGGSFSIVGGIRAESVARYDPDTKRWSALGAGLASGFVTVITPFDDGGGEKLFVGGFFANAAGLPGTSAIAAWDGRNWSSVGGGTSGSVWAIEPSDFDGDLRLYVAGGYDSIGGVTAGGIAVWDGKNFAPVGTGVGIAGTFSPFANGILDFDDGNGPALYIVGRFASVDGVPSEMVSKWDGNVWSRIGNGLAAPNSLRSLESITVFDDGNGAALYVGGTPIRINGLPGEHSVAKWGGTEWTPVGQNVGGRVTRLIGWNDGSGMKLYLSGTATPDINYFARLEGDRWVPVDGGVAGPAIPPSQWPSVFGLSMWGKDLLIGGNFTRVGSDLLPSNGMVMRTSCESRCTGKERLTLRGCRDLGNGKVKYKAKVKRGAAQQALTLRVNDDPGTDTLVVLNRKGKGKAKFRGVPAGRQSVEILECGVTKVYDCP